MYHVWREKLRALPRAHAHAQALPDGKMNDDPSRKHRLTSTNLNSDAIFCMTSATAANKTGNSRRWQAAIAAR